VKANRKGINVPRLSDRLTEKCLSFGINIRIMIRSGKSAKIEMVRT
jgi:hypothetical protein